MTNERRINTRHKWLWVLHVIVYPYVLYCYFVDRYKTDEAHKEKIEARIVWVPMDCILTSCVIAYYLIYLYLERKYDLYSNTIEDRND